MTPAAQFCAGFAIGFLLGVIIMSAILRRLR